MPEKIYIGINNKRIEAKGEVLEQILQDRANFEAEQKAKQAEQKAKEAARESALTKLKALGLTDVEINALIKLPDNKIITPAL